MSGSTEKKYCCSSVDGAWAVPGKARLKMNKIPDSSRKCRIPISQWSNLQQPCVNRALINLVHGGAGVDAMVRGNCRGSGTNTCTTMHQVYQRSVDTRLLQIRPLRDRD